MADALSTLLRNNAYRLSGTKEDYVPILDCIGDASIVLLGEATHGSHEFYQIRSELTQQLIAKRGFNALALEADWPDVARVNRFIHGDKTDKNSRAALENFKRFPQWMWRNVPMVDLVGALYRHNQKVSENKKVSLYGLDLYSLYTSIQAVLAYLGKRDPIAAQRAARRYECFGQYQHNAQLYGYAATFNVAQSCEQNVVDQLQELLKSKLALLKIDGQQAHDSFFDAERNATIVKNAETYYRSLFFSTAESSWNIRDTHMAQTTQAILDHMQNAQGAAKIIIWAHNSHIGNAAATQMGKAGEINIGQLLKEKYGNKVVSIGFTTYSGTVSAASEWDGPVERKQVRPALEKSYEALFHALSIPNFFLPLGASSEVREALAHEYLERAIGVIYRPETERASHYFYAQLANQFDAIIHCDQTRAVEPLEKTAQWISSEFPETYPTGI